MQMHCKVFGDRHSRPGGETEVSSGGWWVVGCGRRRRVRRGIEGVSAREDSWVTLLGYIYVVECV